LPFLEVPRLAQARAAGRGPVSKDVTLSRGHLTPGASEH